MAAPREQQKGDDGAPLLEIEGLKKHFPIVKGFFSRTVGRVHAVDGISLAIARGETVGLVGESGCGKSTAGKTILKLTEPTAGTIRLDGQDITHLDARATRPFRRRMQIIFQDPYSSLNPRMTAGDIVREPLVIHGMSKERLRDRHIAELFDRVGLSAESMAKYPHEFSGGQRQRISIARALVLDPGLIVCDEAVSALDVSIQAQVVNLLVDLQAELGLSYLFIAHDLAVVEHISDRVAVMYLGKLVEMTSSEELYRNPLHPYTRALLAAIPLPEPGGGRERIELEGDVPSPANPPSGCPFHPRCPIATAECAEIVPEFREVERDHFVACIKV